MVVFLTRKYPPSTGGMETFSAELFKAFPSPARVVHFGSKQRDIFWVIPRMMLSAFLLRKEASVFHLGDGVLALLAPFLRLISKAPIVVTFHALELVYPSRVLSFLIGRSLSSIDWAVCVSEYTRGLLHERGFPVERTSVITHGAEHIFRGRNEHPISRREAREKLFARLREELPPSVTKDDWMRGDVLLTVGRLVERKGVPWFIREVLSRLQKRPRERRLYYLVVGTGPERETVARAIVETGAKDSIFALGRVEQEVLKLVYTAADVFVMPNVKVNADAEGFGFVAIEAALSGLTVISSRLEGITSAIVDGKNGYLLEAKDADAYEERIEDVLRQPTMRAAFGESARRFTEAEFRWDDVGRRYAELFTRLIQGRKKT